MAESLHFPALVHKPSSCHRNSNRLTSAASSPSSAIRTLPAHLLRAFRLAASRPGERRHRHRQGSGESFHRAQRNGAGLPGVQFRKRWKDLKEPARSGTCAIRRPARARSKTRSRSWSIPAAARSPSATTATWSMPPSCATNSKPRAPFSRPRSIARSSCTCWRSRAAPGACFPRCGASRARSRSSS